MIIGDECFENVDLFSIDGLNELKYIKIGINSFTHLKGGDVWNDYRANNPNRSFSILNCGELKVIEIGLYSFSDYGGKFELFNLPKLSTIKIGEIGESMFFTWYSRNFYCCSFVIKGMIYGSYC